MTAPMNRCLMQLDKRAENQEPQTLVRTFVDAGPLMTLLSTRNHQILYGRRGTGKTHVLAYLGETAQAEGSVVVRLDMRRIGSNGSIYADPEIPLPERATRLALDVLGAIHEQLVDVALAGDAPASVLNALDQLADHIASVEVVGPLEMEKASGQQQEEAASRQDTLEAGSTAGKLSLSGQTSQKYQQSHNLRVKVTGTQHYRVSFGAVGSTLQRIVDGLPSKRLWLLVDEWSVVPLQLRGRGRLRRPGARSGHRCRP
jgi:hypothetical protein